MEWISVEDRSPEVCPGRGIDKVDKQLPIDGYSCDVLAITDKNTFLLVMLGYVKHSTGSPLTPLQWYYKNGNRIHHTVKITHWMPLPDPPEEEE
jgi:hypothetical protein